MSNFTVSQNFRKPAFSVKTLLSLVTLFGIGITLNIVSAEVASAAGIVGNGTAASCTEAALNTALTGGGNVYFNCGTSPVTITVTSTKIISANTMIDGANNGAPVVTISGGGTTRIFNTAVNGIQFTVKNLTIANSNSNNFGGAITNGSGGKLTVINCKFNNNLGNNGGVIYSDTGSTVMVDKSTFTNNRAAQSGAIYTRYSDLTVTNSTFTGNNSSGSGGAILYLGANGDNGKIILRANTFTNNTAVNGGGAIYSQLYNRETSLIDNNTFSGNSVSSSTSGRGGAIYNVSSTLNNQPGFTGGTNSTVLTITNSTFSANTALLQGGGLYDTGLTTVNITNSTFSGNQATNTTNGQGGAIWTTTLGKINITNSTIANNTAGNSGGGIFGGSTSKLTNTIIANNVANNNLNNRQNCSVPLGNAGQNLQFTSRNANSNECGSAIQFSDPKLGALANNGGRTQTMLLLPGSPAINAGNNATCPTTDQRSVLRSKGGTCDIGAVEIIP